jgi:hypothetical protein
MQPRHPAPTEPIVHDESESDPRAALGDFLRFGGAERSARAVEAPAEKGDA